MTPEWAASKAQAVVDAWRARYGSTPSKAAVLRVLWVALHETRCGDAWPGEHNWGAVQRRALSAAERAVVRAGGTPEPPDANAALHGDSSPVNGRYQAWFWAFPSDVEGAGKLLEVLLDKRPAIKARAATCTAWELAELMYRSRYYEGVHDPRPSPGEVAAKGALTKGQTANVSDYAAALRRAQRAFDAALERWTPEGGLEPEPWPPTMMQLLEGPRVLQAALLACGYDPGPLDGRPGDKTRAAVRAFQRAEGLKVDGMVGPVTRACLADIAESRPRPEGY